MPSPTYAIAVTACTASTPSGVTRRRTRAAPCTMAGTRSATRAEVGSAWVSSVVSTAAADAAAAAIVTSSSHARIPLPVIALPAPRCSPYAAGGIQEAGQQGREPLADVPLPGIVRVQQVGHGQRLPVRPAVEFEAVEVRERGVAGGAAALDYLTE